MARARSFRSRSVDETRALGRALGERLAAAADPGLVVALDGDLGAGKTVFVKGMAEGLGVPARVVSSPTFVIAQRYDGPRCRLHHVDLYRIEDASELDGFGFDEMLDPPGIAAIEWSSRFPAALPRDHLSVRIERGGQGACVGSTPEPDARVLEVAAHGARSDAALAVWEAAWDEAVGDHDGH